MTVLELTCMQVMEATLTLEFCTLPLSLADPSPSLNSESEDVTLTVEDSLSDMYWECLALLSFTFKLSLLRKCGGLYVPRSDLFSCSLFALGFILLGSFSS